MLSCSTTRQYYDLQPVTKSKKHGLTALATQVWIHFSTNFVQISGRLIHTSGQNFKEIGKCLQFEAKLVRGQCLDIANLQIYLLAKQSGIKAHSSSHCNFKTIGLKRNPLPNPLPWFLQSFIKFGGKLRV